jgi:hypothetical protein
LIALIINVHTLGRMYEGATPRDRRQRRTLIRKTSLLRKIEPMAMRSSVANKKGPARPHLAMKQHVDNLEIVHDRRE